jgi:pimeloyl-ACP methyl ester carboxylesterase
MFDIHTIDLPRSRRRRTSERVRLPAVVFRAAEAVGAPRAPIVWLVGGPGSAALQEARRSAAFFARLAKSRDVIVFDQRGANGAWPDLTVRAAWPCAIDAACSREQWSAAVRSAALDATRRLASEGTALADFNTLENADDVIDVAAALGHRAALCLVGRSYGTQLAQQVLRAHGQRVQSVVLALVEPLHATLKLPAVIHGHIARLCEALDADAGWAPLFGGRRGGALARLWCLRETLRAEPVLETTADGRKVAVGEVEFVWELCRLAGERSAIAALPWTILRGEAGSFARPAMTAVAEKSGPLPMMQLAIDVAHGADAARRARIAAEAGGSITGDLIDGCVLDLLDHLPVPDLGDVFRQPVRWDGPAWLLSGEHDARTPAQGAAEVAAGLKGARHSTLLDCAHELPLTADFADALADFFDGRAGPNHLGRPGPLFAQPLHSHLP